MTNGRTPMARQDWLAAVRRFIVAVFMANLVWETAQMPLYTLWYTGTVREITWAILHCTLGDVMVASAGLIAALALVGTAAWPGQRTGTVIAVLVIGCVGYTIYSEYLNTVIRRSWSYSPWMPRLPWLGTGLSPLAQWLIIPPLTLTWAGHGAPILKQATCGKTSP
jgi:hypothetical protein